MGDSRATLTLLPLPPRGRVRRYDDDASTLAVLNAFGEGILVFGETMLACPVRHARCARVNPRCGAGASGPACAKHTARNYGRPWSTLAELTTVGQSRARQKAVAQKPAQMTEVFLLPAKDF